MFVIPPKSQQRCSAVSADETFLDLWNIRTGRPPIDTHHPAVRTPPVTGWKVLNVNPAYVTGFAELHKLEAGTYRHIVKTGNCPYR